MARSRLRMNERAIADLLTGSEITAELERRAQAIADAANNESSWGGYYSAVTNDGNRSRARVWNIKSGASDDESRNGRLLRNLDSGR